MYTKKNACIPRKMYVGKKRTNNCYLDIGIQCKSRHVTAGHYVKYVIKVSC